MLRKCFQCIYLFCCHYCADMFCCYCWIKSHIITDLFVFVFSRMDILIDLLLIFSFDFVSELWIYSSYTQCHSGETDEANCSWLHPVWPPPKRPDRDSTFCVLSRASTDLIFCIHRDFDVRNNVYKSRRLVCECCRDISAWKSRVMKPTVFGDEANFWGAFAWDEANWVWMKPAPHLRRASKHSVWLLIVIQYLVIHQ